MLIKKVSLFMLILSAAAVMESCNSSNGDRSKSGDADTVGSAQKGSSMKKDSTNGLKDTVKHP